MKDELIPILTKEDKLYKDYFSLFLERTNQKEQAKKWLKEVLLPTIENREVLIDAGAGNGSLLKIFLDKFSQCIAIEPNQNLNQELINFIDKENIYPTTIIDAPNTLPKADLVISSHVKYYIPPSEWKKNTDKIISWLKPRGCFVEILGNQYSDCQKTIAEFFGREHVREIQDFSWQYHRDTGVRVEIDTRQAWITTTSIQEMVDIVIFTLNNVGAQILANHPQRPSSKDLYTWVENHYYNAGVYRISNHQDFVRYTLN